MTKKSFRSLNFSMVPMTKTPPTSGGRSRRVYLHKQVGAQGRYEIQ
jgi:hypothetical protein